MSRKKYKGFIVFPTGAIGALIKFITHFTAMKYAFSVAVLALWNNISSNINMAPILMTFKKTLKLDFVSGLEIR